MVIIIMGNAKLPAARITRLPREIRDRHGDQGIFMS
jgi:hypothetical protein